jgi:MFS family permease
MGWTSPAVIAELSAGALLLAAFLVVESRVKNPMFRLPLFRIKAFSFGTLSTLLAAVGRGSLMFMLIIWLQGVWLPERGYSFAETPLRAGIYMLPLTLGFLLAGPISGILSDRFGARPFATGGMLGACLSFALFLALPVDFSYLEFAVLLLLNGMSMGAFATPNRAGVMNSLPPQHRGAAGGMNATFQNSAQVLSIGIFFTLMIVGLSSALSTSLRDGLARHGVPPAVAAHAAHLPPVSTLLAAFLGYNPIEHLVGRTRLARLPASDRRDLSGHDFFARLISSPFHSGLEPAFLFAVIACAVAAVASAARGERYVYPVKTPTPERPRP